MKIFDVYPVYDIQPQRGEGTWIWDSKGKKYLDFYGGHAVISIGHSHPHFLQRLHRQMQKMVFYSNAIINPLQSELAEKLGDLADIPDYQLFLCNSGAEANENALKLASFHTKKKKVISFTKGFHGRTSLAVAVTDNTKIIAPINETENAIILPLNDEKALRETFDKEEIAAVIIEGIQGIGGIYEPSKSFMQLIRKLCDEHGALFIADSVQCGCGRSGDYFAHDFYQIKADVYTMAKGIGNGFPIGAVAIAPHIKPWYGMLGSTFGGNHLACAAALAVAEVMRQENLMSNAKEKGAALIEAIKSMPHVKEVRGRGLMLGIEFDFSIKELRNALLKEYGVFTGSASNTNVLRLLPPLSIKKKEVDFFLDKLNIALQKIAK